MRLPALLAACAALSAAAPRIVYTKVFPGSEPAYARIIIERDGSAAYQEAAGEEAEAFKLDAAATEAIFALAGKLDQFKRQLESGLKVAKMGEKTYRWEDGATAFEVKYNHTNNGDALALQNWFENITQSERALIELRRTARFDRLGVNDALIRLETLWKQKRVVGPGQFLTLLDRVARNESYMNIARERAAALADAFRGNGKALE
jgi:hypothetical protein